MPSTCVCGQEKTGVHHTSMGGRGYTFHEYYMVVLLKRIMNGEEYV